MNIRPSILLGELMLGGIAILAMFLNFEPIAGVAVGGIIALLPKLIESEEKTN